MEIKLPDRKAPSLNRTSKQVLPTPESPINITWEENKDTNKGMSFKLFCRNKIGDKEKGNQILPSSTEGGGYHPLMVYFPAH